MIYHEASRKKIARLPEPTLDLRVTLLKNSFDNLIDQSHPGPQWRVPAKSRVHRSGPWCFSFYGPPFSREGSRLSRHQVHPFRRCIMANSKKKEYLNKAIEHVDITKHNVVPLVDSMASMAYSARDLHRAAEIYDRMLRDKDCGVIL